MRDGIKEMVRKQVAILQAQVAVIQEQLEHTEMLLALLDPEQETLPGLAVQSGPAGGQPELISEAPAVPRAKP